MNDSSFKRNSCSFWVEKLHSSIIHKAKLSTQRYKKPDCIEKSTIQKNKKGLSIWFEKLLSFRKTTIKDVHRQNKDKTMQATNSAISESILSPVKENEQEHENTNEIVSMGSGSNDIMNIPKKDIVPLRQFLRYSINRSDKRAFKRHRFIRPYKGIYEIEWEKDQWLQLDRSTNRQIDRLQRKGFTQIAIRKDAFLRKYIEYDNPNDIDVLLELSLHPENAQGTSKVHSRPEPISCHQPNRFSVRRISWWKTYYEVAEAYLPNWIDSDLCCDAVLMDAQSVLAAMTTNSKSTASSIQQPKLPDTPIVSSRSSFVNYSQNDDSWLYKSLKYVDPPFLSDKPIITIS